MILIWVLEVWLFYLASSAIYLSFSEQAIVSLSLKTQLQVHPPLQQFKIIPRKDAVPVLPVKLLCLWWLPKRRQFSTKMFVPGTICLVPTGHFQFQEGSDQQVEIIWLFVLEISCQITIFVHFCYLTFIWLRQQGCQNNLWSKCGL